MFCLVAEGMPDDSLHYNLICCKCLIYRVFHVMKTQNIEV